MESAACECAANPAVLQKMRRENGVLLFGAVPGKRLPEVAGHLADL